MQVSGFESNSLDFVDVDCQGRCESYGLTLDVELVCDYGKLFCDGSLDYDYNPLAPSMADAIWYKAGEYVLRWLIGSTDLNRVSMMNGEMLEKFMGDYRQKYDLLVAEIIGRVDITQSGCLACKDKWGLTKRTLLS